MPFDYPYSFVALPFLTYVVYKNGVDGLPKVALIAFIVSLGSIGFIPIILVAFMYYLVFYFISTVVLYNRRNLFIITLIQVIPYFGLIYWRTGLFSVFIFIKLMISYIIFNYFYMGSD